jgi:hypothetical protein
MLSFTRSTDRSKRGFLLRANVTLNFSLTVVAKGIPSVRKVKVARLDNLPLGLSVEDTGFFIRKCPSLGLFDLLNYIVEVYMECLL